MSKNLSNPQEDMRVRRTRKLLWEALFALLNERSFEEISVTDICEKAMVNRTTFYNHFESKYDLLIYGMKSQQENIGRKQRQARTPEEKMQAMAQVFEEIAAHPHFYAYLLTNKEERSYSTLLRHQMAENMEARLEEQAQNNERNFSIPPSILAQFYAGALFALKAWWIENEMPISAEELARYWLQLCQGEEPLSIFEQDP